MEKTFRAGEKARARVMTPSRLADAVRGQVDSADMNKSVNQFTYVDGDQCVALPPAAASEAALTARPLRHRYVFMNLDSFEETRLPRVRLCQLRGLPLQRLTPPSRQDDAWAKYLKEGANVNLLTWNGKVIDVETPNNVVLKARPPARAQPARELTPAPPHSARRLSTPPARTRATPRTAGPRRPPWRRGQSSRCPCSSTWARKSWSTPVKTCTCRARGERASEGGGGRDATDDTMCMRGIQVTPRHVDLR